MRKIAGHFILFALASCGVPSNPENGPVVLLCEGEDYLRAANGEVERHKITQFYKIDGVAQSLEKWSEDTQKWMRNSTHITITPNQIRSESDSTVMAGISSKTTINFDRVAGRITNEFSMSNGGIQTFEGSCRPVKSPTSERKI